MEDPNLIAILIPADNFNLAENAFRGGNNRQRCLPPTEKEGSAISSRDATPVCEPFQNGYEDYDNQGNTHRIRLTFDPEPKDPSKGYAFGTDQQKCDVQLAHRGVRSTSGVHFHITFDIFHGERRLVLKDSSTNGTAVSYNRQAEEEVRHYFPWILNLEKQNGEWEIKVHVRGLIFKVQLASHRTCEAEYKKNVDAFLKFSQTTNPPLGGLSIDSHMTGVAPSQSRTPGQRPVYIHEEPLGNGSYGQVDRVIDISTGAIYAHKTFHEPLWATDKERRRHQRKEWLDEIRREIRIMMEHPHEHIVPLLDFQEDPRPFFVMPFLPLGNLNQVHHKTPLAERETIELLFQGLTVLEHLHSRGVAHRDLKPENILVERRSPLHLQFADFGLASDQLDLKTFCGTEQYSAPEIYTGENYTTAVDIWSLGVIVLEYVYGLPTLRTQARMNGKAVLREHGLAWCCRLVEYANDWDSDSLINLLTTEMLQMDAGQRLSARNCLTRAHERGLFDDSSAGVGRTTPTRPMVLTSGMRNEEEAPTIIMGALWDAERKGSNHDGDRQAGGSAFERPSATSTSKGAPRLRMEPSEAVSDLLSGHLRSSLEPSCPLEARSIRRGSKRHRSPAVSSPGQLSDKSQVKRRPAEARFTEARESCVSKLSPLLDSTDEVVKANAEHLQMMIEGQVVLMRDVDCTINATQIIKLTGKTKDKRDQILRRLKTTKKVVLRPARGTYGAPNTWVSIQDGKELCVELGLAGKLQPLLDHGLSLRQDRSSGKSLVGRKPVLRDPANGPEESPPFMEVIAGPRPVLVRKSDWRINATRIANQVMKRPTTDRLRRSLNSSSYDIVGGRYAGTYVDFDLGIKYCRELGLNDLANQLLHLRRTENEGAVDVQQDAIASPVLENPADLPHAVPVSSQSVNSDPVRAPAMAGRSCSKGLSSSDGSVDAGDEENSTAKFFSEESCLPMGTNVTRSHARESNESNGAVSSRQSHDEAEKNQPEHMGGNPSRKTPSYYSDRDFVARNSQLQEVKLGLQTPSRASSRYGSPMAWPRGLGFDEHQ
ncbi:MAG: hypothetical protein LQ337_007857, partial [Flavoplaca oasis]